MLPDSREGAVVAESSSSYFMAQPEQSSYPRKTFFFSWKKIHRAELIFYLSYGGEKWKMYWYDFNLKVFG